NYAARTLTKVAICIFIEALFFREGHMQCSLLHSSVSQILRFPRKTLRSYHLYRVRLYTRRR
ncbi:hypothetical protein, partial [Rectinema subterraneum]